MTTIVAIALAVLAGALMGRVWVGIVRARRRRALEAGEPAPAAPSLLGNGDQRRRALWIAVALAAGATAAAAAGISAVATPLLWVAILLTVQTALFEVIARMRRDAPAD